MSKLRFEISISLDGYVAGPNQSEENPLGEGGEQLHEWIFKLAAWREPHGREGGEVNASTPSGRGSARRRRRGDHGPQHVRRWPWAVGRGPLAGLVGARSPRSRMPVFVLTHHEREPLTLGETTFTFVTDGIESALEQAKEAAGELGRPHRRRRRGRPAVPRPRAWSTRCSSTSCRSCSATGPASSRTAPARASTLEQVLVVDTPEVTHLRYRVG